MTRALPHRDSDTILTLYAHYFLAADLMLRKYKELNNKRSKAGRLSMNKEKEETVFFFSWLGFLGVTCEGFNKARIFVTLRDCRPDKFNEMLQLCGELGRMIREHDDALRKVRNNIFHLRDSTDDLREFILGGGPVRRTTWAEQLHEKFAEFFSDYRTTCEVYYLLEDRRDESVLWAAKAHRTPREGKQK